ncbi:hypothetical protein ColKHC_14071 [Colletotrichum higginsianum]|nr:hypothetical protein ColKHC_14071 [Colletotrichum higginsianum]
MKLLSRCPHNKVLVPVGLLHPDHNNFIYTSIQLVNNALHSEPHPVNQSRLVCDHVVVFEIVKIFEVFEMQLQ